MKICEHFKGCQGEGSTNGYSTFFIRMTGCNRYCKYCDSTYAFDEGTEYAIDDVVKIIRSQNLKRITWTGGEPGLCIKEIKELIKVLGNEYKHEIETNGTIYFDTKPFEHVTVSPKDPGAKIEEFNKHTNVIFKPVIDSEADIKYWIDIFKENDVPMEKVWLQPQGVDSESLKKRAKMIVQACLKYGCNISPRMHIWLFGNVRGK